MDTDSTAAPRVTGRQWVEYRPTAYTEPMLLGVLQAVVEEAVKRGAPPDAQVVALMGDRGTQRDPEPVLRGVRVTWGG